MGTKRFNTSEKRDLILAVERLLGRLVRADICPIKSSRQFMHIVEELMPKELSAAIKTVEDFGGVCNRTYQHSFLIRSTVKAENYRVAGSTPTMLPNHRPSIMPPHHPLYSEMFEFCQRYYKNKEMRAEAEQFFNGVLENCSTAGQLVRVLPYLEKFLKGNALASLGDAERNSRWPAKLPSEWEIRQKVSQLHDTLALASLLPEDGSLPCVNVIHPY